MTIDGGARRRLAEAQERLLCALVAGGPIPEGFDEVKTAAASRALLRKRARQASRAWPFLAATFDPRLQAEFARYAGSHPLRTDECGFEDARRFARATGISPRRSEWLPVRSRWMRVRIMIWLSLGSLRDRSPTVR